MRGDDTSGGRFEGLLRRAALAFAVTATAALLLWLAGHVVQVLIIAFAGVLLALFLSGIGEWVSERAGGPPRLWTAIACAVIAALTALVVWLTAPRVAREVDVLTRDLPRAVDRLMAHLQDYRWGQAIVERLRDAAANVRTEDAIASAGPVVWTSGEAIGGAVIVLFLGLFIAFEPRPYREGLVRLFPEGRRPGVEEALGALAHVLRRWLVGRLLAMAAVWILTWIGLAIIGLPIALTLALLAGILTFVPYVGPLISAVPAALIGLLASPTMAVWVLVVYLIAHIVEGYLMTPLVQRKAVFLPPAIILFSQMLFGALAGLLGVMFATPLAATTVVLVKKVYVEGVLGDRGAEREAGREPSSEGK